jgi:hypothetical protein
MVLQNPRAKKNWQYQIRERSAPPRVWVTRAALKQTDLMPPMLSAHVIVIAARVGMYLRNKLVVKHRFSPGQLRSEKSPFA